jgi:ATP-dependent Clp endopeptidase proteolytic subunit ClpP
VTEDAKVTAEIELIKAQTRKADNEARKEDLLAKGQELVYKEAKRSYDSLLASNSENRIYDFIGAVTTTSTEQAIAQLSRWKRQSTDPITIRITSPGGSVWDGLAFYDYILGLRQSGIKVNVVVFGMAASMSAVLLQAGDRRVVAPNAQVMIHEMEVQFPSAKVSEQEEQTKFSKKLNDRLYEIIASRCKLSKTEIAKRALKKDWWLNAQEVLDAGIADAVGFE